MSLNKHASEKSKTLDGNSKINHHTDHFDVYQISLMIFPLISFKLCLILDHPAYPSVVKIDKKTESVILHQLLHRSCVITHQ